VIIADTCVWSLALRRRKEVASPVLSAFKLHLSEDRIVLLGAIIQELLAGIHEPERLIEVEESLHSVPTILATVSDHILAAKFYNTCRKKGIQASFVDSLICAMAVRHNLKILTTDHDFLRYSQYLPIDLELIQ
jgi:predicted nucleic acid-binding protein